MTMWDQQCEKYVAALDGHRATAFAQELGVSADALRRIHAGWDSEAYTFPEVDGKNKITGIARRFPGGRKGYHKGGKRGLVVPSGILSTDQPVAIAEGPTDVAAALSIGLIAVGRPSSQQGGKLLAKLLAQRPVVVLGENDQKPDGKWPGRDGAQEVARELAALRAQPVGWAMPPPGNKDLRDWIRACPGLTAEEFLATLRNVTTVEYPVDAPRPFGSPSVPRPFPLNSVPQPLRSVVEELARVVRVDVAFPAMLVCVALSAAAGNAYRIRVSRSHVEPNLSRYLMAGAPPGERKSALFSHTLTPFKKWMLEAMPKYEAAMSRAQADSAFYAKQADSIVKQGSVAKDPAKIEQLRLAAQQAREKVPQPPRPPAPYVGDITSEALTREMAIQGGATAAFSADARGMIDNIMGRYRKDGAASDDVYLRAHGGDPVDRIRIGNKGEGDRTSITNPALALCALLQPDKLGDVVRRPDLMNSGFVPRCGLVLPKSLVGTRIETGNEEPMDSETEAAWNTILLTIYDQRWKIVDAATPVGSAAEELTLSEDAQVARREFANELETRQAAGQDLARVSGFASKTAGEAARLAGVLHLARLAHQGRLPYATDEAVSLETWEAAEACQRWVLEETLRVVNVITEQGTLQRASAVLAWVARKPDERREFTTRMVLGGNLTGIKDASDAEAVMDTLQRHGWATKKDPIGRQRTPRWTIHAKTFLGGRPWERSTVGFSNVQDPHEQCSGGRGLASAETADLLTSNANHSHFEGERPDRVSNLSFESPNRVQEQVSKLCTGPSTRSGAPWNPVSKLSTTIGDVGKAIDAFRQANPILDVIGDSLSKTANTNGGEYHGPCPRCGGNDRFICWPQPQDGKPRAWCRQCGTPGTGDALDWSIYLAGQDPSDPGARGRYLRQAEFLNSAPSRSPSRARPGGNY